MEPSIFRYILRHSLRGQVYLLILTGISLPLVYATLEIPKRIVNQALTADYEIQSIFGVRFDQIEFLLTLCFTYLGLVILSGGLKYVINVYAGILGERTLRRLRFELYSRVLRFPLPHFKRVSQGEIIPMITAETEPLGGFVGESFMTPAVMGGTLATYLIFIMVQDWVLGLAAIATYPLQMWLIPKLQKRVNELARERVRTVRSLADRIGETVSGVTEIHAHDRTRLERADFSERLGTIFTIRFDIYKRKFFIKFLNNFLASVTPFFFYSVGGWFVIEGEISLGALVAVLAAYKDLSSPWKEILKYYQVKEDIRVKYEQVVEQFQVPDMLDPELLDEEPAEDRPLEGEIRLSNVSLTEDGVVKVIDNASVTIPIAQHTAIVGTGGSGKDYMGLMLARLAFPTGGNITFADMDATEIPEAVLGRRTAYAGASAFIFAGTVRDNLFYGLKHEPLRAPDYDEHERQEREKWLEQTELAGNLPLDVRADWLDYEAAGASDRDELEAMGIELLGLVEMEEDLYQLGLANRIDPEALPNLADKILQARMALRERLHSDEFKNLVEPFDEGKFNLNASVAENLVFGTSRDPAFDTDSLAQHPYTMQVLEHVGIRDMMIETGCKVAETMVDLFAGLPSGHEFFEQYAFVSADELPEYQTLVSQVAQGSIESISEEDRLRLLGLTFKLISGRHRLGLMTEEFQKGILKAREIFKRDLPEALRDEIQFFSTEEYNADATIQDNILFGKLVYGQALAQAKVGQAIREVVETLDLRRDIMAAGLNYHVGIAGARLSLVQRQKLALARCLLKNPDLLIVNEATGSFDAAVEARIMDRMIERLKGKGLVWVLGRVERAMKFDRVIVMEDGKVAEEGRFDELSESGRVLPRLLEHA